MAGVVEDGVLPPSRRMVKMEEVMGKALDFAVHEVTFSDVRACFPEIAKNHGDILDDLSGQVLQKVRSNIECEFERVCEEADLKHSLSKLDALLEEQPMAVDGTRRPPLQNVIAEGQKLLLDARRQRVEAKRQRVEVLRKISQQMSAEVAAARADVENRQTILQRSVEELNQHTAELTRRASAVNVTPPVASTTGMVPGGMIVA